MVSIGAMIKKLSGLIGTNDINDWENQFIGDIWERTQQGKVTATLSARQVETVERIYNRHFSG